jgi:HPt (histidine-containing phosphotransfer) domain-containing protein
MEDNYKYEVSEKLYDFEQLEEIAAGDPDFLIALAQIFLDTIPGNSLELVKAAKSGDWSLVSKLAHKLKSTIDSMNMVSITNDVRTLEFDGKNKANTGGIVKLAEKVNVVIHQVAAQLKEEFAL